MILLVQNLNLEKSSCDEWIRVQNLKFMLTQERVQEWYRRRVVHLELKYQVSAWYLDILFNNLLSEVTTNSFNVVCLYFNCNMFRIRYLVIGLMPSNGQVEQVTW